MRTWSARTADIAGRHYDREAVEWGRFRSEVESAWNQELVAGGGVSSAQEWETAIERMHPVEPFLVELFHNPAQKDVNRPGFVGGPIQREDGTHGTTQ
jgi:hypothetical protein